MRPNPPATLMRSRTLAGALAAAALVAVGCGSSGGGGARAPATPAVATTVAQPSQPPATTKADFIALADRACRHTNQRLKPIISRLVKLDQSTQPLAFR